MKSPISTSKITIVLATVLSLVMMAGCISTKLSEDFDEDKVRIAAENVIDLINSQDSDGL